LREVSTYTPEVPAAPGRKGKGERVSSRNPSPTEEGKRCRKAISLKKKKRGEVVSHRGKKRGAEELPSEDGRASWTKL